MSSWGIHTRLGAWPLQQLPSAVFGKKSCCLGLEFHTSEMSDQDQEMAHILWFSVVIGLTLKRAPWIH